MVDNLVKILIENNLTITTAESCTGGLISSKIVDVPNASKVFNMGFVTYSNESKEMLLGVSHETILKYGVVSEEVAKEMVIGACNKSGADVGIAVSGIAGPSGATLNKPVGMVCFGFKVLNNVYTKTMYFGNRGRNIVRNDTVEYAIKYLVNLLEDLK